MTKAELKYEALEILGTETPIEIKLDPKKIEFLILYKHGLIQYMSPRQFSWIIGVHEDTIHKKIENKVYPYHLFFTKVLGGGCYRIHVSRVSAIMSGKGTPGDTRKTKRQIIGERKDVTCPPMTAVSKDTLK